MLFRSGVLDDEGYLVITGRIKDIIIRKGENISAKEIEDLLFSHPDVRDVAAFGLSDPSVGERCCVALVVADDTTVDLHDVTRHLSDLGLARYKLPERMVVVDELPRNATGKVLKSELPPLLARDAAPRA